MEEDIRVTAVRKLRGKTRWWSDERAEMPKWVGIQRYF